MRIGHRLGLPTFRPRLSGLLGRYSASSGRSGERRTMPISLTPWEAERRRVSYAVTVSAGPALSNRCPELGLLPGRRHRPRGETRPSAVTGASGSRRLVRAPSPEGAAGLAVARRKARTARRPRPTAPRSTVALSGRQPASTTPNRSETARRARPRITWMKPIGVAASMAGTRHRSYARTDADLRPATAIGALVLGADRRPWHLWAGWSALIPVACGLRQRGS